MPKITFLENGQYSANLYLVYLDGTYKAVLVRDGNVKDAIALLPPSTPNFTKIIARNTEEAIEKAKAESLGVLVSKLV